MGAAYSSSITSSSSSKKRRERKCINDWVDKQAQLFREHGLSEEAVTRAKQILVEAVEKTYLTPRQVSLDEHGRTTSVYYSCTYSCIMRGGVPVLARSRS